MNYGLGPVSGGGLSLLRILSSISRTLGVVRQVTPIYRDIKPLLSKAPEFFSRLNSIRNNVRDTRDQVNSVYLNAQENNATLEKSSGPVFFQ